LNNWKSRRQVEFFFHFENFSSNFTRKISPPKPKSMATSLLLLPTYKRVCTLLYPSCASSAFFSFDTFLQDPGSLSSSIIKYHGNMPNGTLILQVSLKYAKWYPYTSSIIEVCQMVPSYFKYHWSMPNGTLAHVFASDNI